MNIAPDKQITNIVRMIALIGEHRRKMIEEAPAFILAPAAPERYLTRIFGIVEELLRPGIYSDRDRNPALGKQRVKLVHLRDRLSDSSFEAEPPIARRLRII